MFILFAIPVTVIATLQGRSDLSRAAACLDISNDGGVDSADSSLLKNQIETKIYSKASDFDSDGVVNETDQLILNESLGETCSPQVTFFASPDSIKIGESAVLTWTVAHASKVEIEGVGEVAKEGEIKVNPTESKTYQLSASGPGGQVVGASTLKVTH